jgi:hypothetical protein
MSRKIPPDAFTYYFSLGEERSYKTLAKKYGCSERAVAKVASKEKWQNRLEDLEVKARAKSDQQILESLEQMNTRHIKTARMLQAKGIEALQGMQIDSVPDALKAVQVGLDKERLIRGEPSERTALDIMRELKRDEEELLVEVDEDAERDGEGTVEAGPVP